MKLLVGQDIGTYTFSAATKTIILSGVTGMTIGRLLVINNSTTGNLIYVFSDPTLTVSSLIYNASASPATTTIVLNSSIDITGMADTDKLLIYIETTKYLNHDTFLPRGHMFNVDSKNAHRNLLQYPNHSEGFDSLCLINSYPTSIVDTNCNNDYPNGYNGAWDSSISIASPNNHGIYIAPKVGRTLFIERINMVAEVANQVDISKPIDRTGAVLQLSHSGNVYCEAKSLADIIIMGENVKQIDSIFNSHFTTYIIPILCKPAGMFNGTNNDYYHIRTSTGKPFYSDYLVHFYLSFTMWEVSL